MYFSTKQFQIVSNTLHTILVTVQNFKLKPQSKKVKHS